MFLNIYSRSERSEWSEFCVQKAGVKKSCPRFRPFVRSSGADAPGLTSSPIFTNFFLFDRVLIDLKTKSLFFRTIFFFANWKKNIENLKGEGGIRRKGFLLVVLRNRNRLKRFLGSWGFLGSWFHFLKKNWKKIFWKKIEKIIVKFFEQKKNSIFCQYFGYF